MDSHALKDNLRDTFLEYRRRRPQLSLRAIARNSGVKRYFLNKILSEDESQDQTQLDLNQVLILTKFLHQSSSADELAKSTAKMLQEVLISSTSAVNTVVPDVKLFDEASYLIVRLASCANGTSRDLLVKILGIACLNTLDKLLEENIVQEVADKITLHPQNQLQESAEVKRAQIGHLAKYFQAGKTQEKNNVVAASIQNVNAEALKEILKIHKDANKKIEKIINDPEKWGSIPMFSLSCMDRFLDPAALLASSKEDLKK